MKNKTKLILVVDDEVEIQRLLKQRFRKRIKAGDLNFQFAQNGVEALQILRRPNEIDMVLTDIRMPEMDGLTLLANIAKLENPLKAVVVSAYGDMKNIRMAMNQGAFDFLTKPIDFEDLEITINKTLNFVSHLREQQQQLQDALNKLHDLVFYDQLTGLPSLNGLMQYLTHCMESHPSRDHQFALLMLDIERYSIIKSGFGHEFSDRLILEVSRRLKQELDQSVILARTGENVFTLLWSSLNSLDTVQDKVEHLLNTLLDSPFQLDEITVSSTSRMGLALSNLPYTQSEDFFQAADTALQIATQQNNNEWVVFDIQMQKKAIERLNLEVELQQAIEAQQLSLHYQPIFRLDTQEIISFEVLVRWEHPIKGRVSPLEFIPLAEETGLIVPLGEWILAAACDQLGRWKVQFGTASPASINVNLSSLQLQSPTLLSCIDSSLKNAGLTGHDLKLEITESVLMENIKEAIELLAQLQKRHIKLSIDDFGTGYSSLAYLQLLPINALKIDSSFVKDIEINPKNFDITSAIIDLADHLDLEVVAEGLEKEEHLEILRSLSCQYGQGFLFSRPLDTSAATMLIMTKNKPLSDPSGE